MCWPCGRAAVAADPVSGCVVVQGPVPRILGLRSSPTLPQSLSSPYTLTCSWGQVAMYTRGGRGLLQAFSTAP